MEASTEFRGTQNSKSHVAVAMVSIAMALGILAGIAANNLGTSTTAPQARSAQEGGVNHTAVAPYDMPGARGFRIGAHL